MRPCSAVIRLLPWGGDFLSLLDYPEYVWKGGEFKNIALKVGALWYSHNLDTPPAKLYSKRRSGDVDTFIFNAVKQNKSYSQMKTLLAQRFPANIRLNHWKYGLNTILGNTTSVLALLGTVLRDTNNCGLKQWWYWSRIAIARSKRLMLMIVFCRLCLLYCETVGLWRLLLNLF